MRYQPWYKRRFTSFKPYRPDQQCRLNLSYAIPHLALNDEGLVDIVHRAVFDRHFQRTKQLQATKPYFQVVAYTAPPCINEDSGTNLSKFIWGKFGSMHVLLPDQWHQFDQKRQNEVTYMQKLFGLLAKRRNMMLRSKSYIQYGSKQMFNE